MKLSAYLLGICLGAILLPLLMAVCFYLFLQFFPVPLGRITIPEIAQQTFGKYIFHGASLGLFSSMLLHHVHSRQARLLSGLCGLLVVGDGLREAWSSALPPFFQVSNNYAFYMTLCTQAPLILWGLTLFFFALTVRSPRVEPHDLA